MKAPQRAHRRLIDAGFTLAGGEYEGPCDHVAAVRRIRLDRHADGSGISGVTFSLDIGYPFRDGAGGIVPFDVATLRADGHCWRPADDPALYFPVRGEQLEQAVETALRWLVTLSDPVLMARLLRFLMGLGECPKEFGYLTNDPLVAKKQTPFGLRSLAAYLNLAGDYRAALEVLETPVMVAWRRQAFDAQILSDASNGRIEFSASRKPSP